MTARLNLKIFPLLFFCCSISLAQKSFFGVDAGVNVANQRVTDPMGFVGFRQSGSFFYKNLVRPTIGVFYHYSLDKIGVRLAAQYMALGYSNPSTGFSFTYSPGSTVNIDYLTFPVSIHYNTNSAFSLNVGTYLSFTVGGTKINSQDITSTYHKNDLGFFFGGEHTVYKNIGVGVNYFLGAKNIWLNDQGGAVKYTNRALQFTLIYKFKKI